MMISQEMVALQGGGEGNPGGDPLARAQPVGLALFDPAIHLQSIGTKL